MELDINVVIKVYQEELNRLMQENLMLKAQIVQMQQEENKQE
jgi:cell division protein FtsB